MNVFQIFGLYLGRFFLSSIFLISSINEMLDWSTTEQYFQMSMTRWTNTLHDTQWMASFLSIITPWLPWLLLLAIIFKLVGSFLLIIGCNVRLGACLLILFLVPATLIVHCFWSLPAQESPIEMVMFMKNISILGGLLVVLVMGSGKSASKTV